MSTTSLPTVHDTNSLVRASGELLESVFPDDEDFVGVISLKDGEVFLFRGIGALAPGLVDVG